MPPALNNRSLAPKESGLFKEVLTLYETRQLKKALKSADLILKKVPQHGETLCMKGLILVHQGHREEGTDLVKTGMRYDLTSHIVWHVFGLIQKAEKKYEDALKSYTQALRFDKENINLLRDAANLQAHLRHYDALVETRHTLLKLRPNARQNWVALAGAQHLAGDLNSARDTLEQYETILKDVPQYDVELSEVLLYRIRILSELGQDEDALALLDSNAKERRIVDRTAIMEQRANLLTKLDRKADAEEAWHALIHHNSDYQEYYQGYLASKGVALDAITDENRAEAISILKGFVEQLPKAAAPKRLLLTIITGEEFTTLLTTYLHTNLRQGIPSLFVDLKPLYSTPSAAETIESIATSFLSSQPQPPTKDAESPSTYIWTIYFLAQHFSYLHNQPKALEFIDLGLSHTPTLPDLYTLRARILKRSGDPFGAAKALNDARLLDLQDRFLNTKCGKYRLRAGLVDEASDVLGLFTKKDAPSPGQDLRDMQSLLFITEEARALEGAGKLGLALKRYEAARKVFEVFEDDQYDFHSYCFRRFNLNVYMSMLKWEDNLRSHPAYIASAVGAVRIYLRLHDDPSLATTATAEIAGDEKKAKKKAAKKASKPEEKKAQASANEDKGLEPPAPKDDDPFGTQLLKPDEALANAAKWVTPFTRVNVDKPEVYGVVYDLAVRQGKILKAAQALLKLRAKVGVEGGAFHERVVHFRHTVNTASTPQSEPIATALNEAMSTLWPSADLAPETYNSQYLQQHGKKAEAVLAAARAAKSIGAPEEEVEGIVSQTLNESVEVDVQTAWEALRFLRDIKASRADEFRRKCAERFALATIFGSEEAIAKRKAEAVVDSLVEKKDVETAV